MPADPHPPHTQYRLVDIPVDRDWARKHNETLAEVRRLQWSAAVLGLLLVAGIVAAVLLSGGAAWAWILAVPLGLFALGCAAMVPYIPRKMGSIEHTYATSELVPALVAEVRPRGLTLLALVDRAVDRSAGSQPSLAVRSCEKLPGHSVTVGERVPCVAVVGNRNPGRGADAYQFVSPMPVAWATDDPTVLRRCRDEIPEGEWETLRRNLDRVPEVEQSRTRVVPLG